METLISRKLRIARESTKMSQSAMFRESGYPQSSISALETGSYVYIPNEFLSYLSGKKIDLTSLFDNSIDEQGFKDICEGRVKAQLFITGQVASGPCPNCAVKDQQLADKIEVIQSKNEVILALHDKINRLEGDDELGKKSASGM